jgi:hypothetical protein
VLAFILLLSFILYMSLLSHYRLLLGHPFMLLILLVVVNHGEISNKETR